MQVTMIDGMAFCDHRNREKRPLRVNGYESPQYVCERCWRYALRNNLVA